MDLDALLNHFFGTTDLDELDEATLANGCQHIRLTFATEQDPGRRFALWVVLHGLDDAPDPARVFKDPRERDAAIAYARAIERAERDDRDDLD
jgi:hypothetical protein